MRKVLYSPGFGAGWSTWCHGDKAARLLLMEFPPLVAAVEAEIDDGTVTAEALQAQWDAITEPLYGPAGWTTEMEMREKYPTVTRGSARGVPPHLRAATSALFTEWASRFPTESLPYLGGLRELKVAEVPDDKRVRINEYDGSESVTIEGDDDEDWL